jgi:hypothetical protein
MTHLALLGVDGDGNAATWGDCGSDEEDAGKRAD